MRLIADESCDFRLVRSLRSAGHDVIAVAETQAGIDDDDVIHRARSERRLLLTEDKDFGQLVFSAAKENSGVLLVRYPALARSGLADAVLSLLTERGDDLYSCFVVLEPGRVRLGRLV
jgi:predicted nuclease of predicted toxin-antitoxin system